jgi:energy-coupling factor transport system permease protein
MTTVHPVAWLAWLVGTMVALSVARNPLHLVLILLCIAVVNISLGAKEEASYAPISLVRFGLIIVSLSALFNALTAHFGESVVLRLPEWLPVLGGPITLEALTFGAINGLALSGILAAFTTFNQASPVSALIRLIPRAYFPVAVVASIGLTFVPITLRQFEQIREAQALRGHRVNGLRDWLPLFIPLLIGGLERALQLAEAMTARGFASVNEVSQDIATRVATVMGLVALLSGWLLRLVWARENLGSFLMLTGMVLVAGVLWFLGRRNPRTTYRRRPWRGLDGAVVVSAAVVALAFSVPGVAQASFYYYPYPSLSMPGFDPTSGVATMGLLAPALVQRQPRNEQSAPARNNSTLD